MLPLHEFVHAIAYGQGLRSPHLLMGAWISRGMLYVVYDAPLLRERVLLMSCAPFLVLTLIPALVLPWLAWPPALLAILWFFVLLHAAVCTGDFLVCQRLLARAPRGAWIHNYGWTTYWKC
jgi:hypothetical protein